MALEIRKAQNPTAGLVADRRLYLTADRSRVVEAGVAGAAYLFATPGTLIPPEDVARYELTSAKGALVLPDAGEREPAKAPASTSAASTPETADDEKKPPAQRRT